MELVLMKTIPGYRIKAIHSKTNKEVYVTKRVYATEQEAREDIGVFVNPFTYVPKSSKLVWEGGKE